MKKIFGMPLALAIIGLLVIGGATAALVSYLSNSVSAQATVEEPLWLKINTQNSAWGDASESIDLGTLYGGDTTTFYIREENRGNSSVTSDLIINITNTDGVDSCEELESVIFENVDAGSIDDITDSCDYWSSEDMLHFVVDSTSMPAGETNTYKIDVTFALGASGPYTANVQHNVDTT